MRKLCWFAFSFSLAIYMAIYLLSEQWIVAAGVFLGLTALGGLIFRGKLRKRILISGLGFVVGFCWFGFYNATVRLSAHALIDLSPAVYTFEVREFPRETQYGAVSFSARLETDEHQSYNVLLYVNDEEALELHPGDRFTANVTLSPSDVRKGESYDYYQSNGIFLICNVKSDFVVLKHSEQISAKYLPQWVAQKLNRLICDIFDEEYSGFFTALLTGDKSRLSDGLYAAFRRVGLAHIVAVSGLHIGFLSALFVIIIRRKNLLTILMQGILLFFFAAVTGNSPSAVRAAFMASTLLIAPLLGREDDRLTTLSAILLLLLLDCPYAATGVSLQLSFAALLGIILCTEKLNVRLSALVPKHSGKFGKVILRVWKVVIGSLSVSVGATIFTIPLIAFHFGSVSIVAVVANLLTLWAVSATFMLGLMAILVGSLCSAAGILMGKVAIFPARWVIWVARSLSYLPFASVSLLTEELIVWFVVAYAVLLIWVFSKVRIRPFIPISVLLLTFVLTMNVQQKSLRESKMAITVLDVGQGSSTLFYSKGETVLVDCGGNKNDAGDIAADYIQFMGSSHLDTLILTHCDSDHTNGVAELLERVKVDRVFLPDTIFDEAEQADILRLCEQYDCEVELLFWEDAVLTFGEAELTIFTPFAGKSRNATCLSVLCSVDDYDVLITGDMDTQAEGLLVKYKNLPDIEFLVVGHHGSKNATSAELLAATKPEIAAISSGYNTYGHPALEVIERLEEAGCRIYRTDERGTMTFLVE